MPTSKQEFIAAHPSRLLIALARQLNVLTLAESNRVHIDVQDIKLFNKIPRGAGIILTPNHADETDPRVCMELSRRLARQFVVMCNREAFDEYAGMAGWALSRLGLFSVNRGAHDAPAKNFAIETIKDGRDVLVVFPEGEIFYLNESVQPFHTGAVGLGMQALLQKSALEADFTTYVVPLAIKYSYSKPIDRLLKKRVGKLERQLTLPVGEGSVDHRLKVILRSLLAKEEQAHDIKVDRPGAKLSEEIQAARRQLLTKLAEKYHQQDSQSRRTIDASWELSAKLRDMLESGAENTVEIRQDLLALHQVAQMVSWQPTYLSGNPSNDRIAEVLLKLEREYYRIKRPRQLGKRNVFLRIAEPMNLAQFRAEYEADAHACRAKLTQTLHDRIQSLIDDMIQ